MEKLIGLAAKFKGYLAFAALIFLGLIWLIPKLFPEGLGGVPQDQLVTVIQFVLGGFFGLTVLLILLGYQKSDPSASGTLFITVHEAGDKTAGIGGAEVRLGLPKPERKQTDSNGSVRLHYFSDHAGKKYPVNAVKEGYQPRKPIYVKMEKETQAWLPLKPENPNHRNPSDHVSPGRDPETDGDLPPLPSCPFVAGPKIEDPRLFVGRREELAAIAWRMTGIQPVSVNVVGDRRIGKSSLLYHFSRTWRDRIQDTSRFKVIYFSLQDAHFQTCAGFYRAISGRMMETSEAGPLHAEDGNAFSEKLDGMKRSGLLPVVCLDEFEMLLKCTNEFTDTFYDHLRSLMDKSALMLVVASLKPLDVYRREKRMTSSFFNLGHTLHLNEMTDGEADDLARLPASTVAGTRAALNDEFQALARKWGGRHPFMIQLAASFLCQAQENGKEVQWAEREFRLQASRFDGVTAADERN